MSLCLPRLFFLRSPRLCVAFVRFDLPLLQTHRLKLVSFQVLLGLFQQEASPRPSSMPSSSPSDTPSPVLEKQLAAALPVGSPLLPLAPVLLQALRHELAKPGFEVQQLLQTYPVVRERLVVRIAICVITSFSLSPSMVLFLLSFFRCCRSLFQV